MLDDAQLVENAARLAAEQVAEVLRAPAAPTRTAAPTPPAPPQINRLTR